MKEFCFYLIKPRLLETIIALSFISILTVSSTITVNGFNAFRRWSHADREVLINLSLIYLT